MDDTMSHCSVNIRSVTSQEHFVNVVRRFEVDFHPVTFRVSWQAVVLRREKGIISLQAVVT